MTLLGQMMTDSVDGTVREYNIPPDLWYMEAEVVLRERYTLDEISMFDEEEALLRAALIKHLGNR